MVTSLEPAVSHLFSQAEALAARRNEPLRGVHLLAALGACSGAVRDALESQHAGFRRVLDQWEVSEGQGAHENLQLLRRRVRELARNFGSRNPDAAHLLLALLDDTSGSARVVLQRLAVDIGQLRSRAVQIGQGLPTRIRRERDDPPGVVSDRWSIPGPQSVPRREPPLMAPRSELRGEAVPVMPPRPIRLPGRAGPITAGPITAGPSHGSSASSASTSPGMGQAVPLVPPVGPTPLPGSRSRATSHSAPEEDEDLHSARPTFSESELGQDGARSSDRSSDVGAGASAPAFVQDDERYDLPKKKFPILTQVGRNLTLQALRGDSDPVVGRDEEIERALDVLAKRHGNNPCLIGAAGVGKTSVARGVAQALASDPTETKMVIEIPIAELIAGTGVRGALAGRIQSLKKEVRATDGRVILFFDEIHQLFSGEGAEEVASELKLSLARGELPCIGATSTSEYQRVFEKDPGLSRRFSPVEVEEPSREDAHLILSSLAERLEAHHGATYAEESLGLAIAWSVRFLPGRCLPDKAVQVLDLAGARARRRGLLEVTPEAVAEVVAASANMPVERLLESDGDRMLNLEDALLQRVVGHEAHLRRIARILRRNAAGLGGRRPIGSFLLLGPTGVGKTETAKAIAEVLFHDDGAMTRIDMAEMSESHAVAKLVGAPPGYVGHDAGGQLTEAVRRRPYQVLLLDEIEKAHPEVLTAFLAVFDEGRMTDSRGRTVDFTNTVIILTSNLGARELQSSSKKRVGFSTSDAAEVADLGVVVEAAKGALAPELYNRIDEVLAFAPLTRRDVKKIARKMVRDLSDELEIARGISLSVTDSALESLLDLGGFEPELGARPLRRTIARRIEAPLAEAILLGELDSGDVWVIDGVDGELAFERLRHECGAAE